MQAFRLSAPLDDSTGSHPGDQPCRSGATGRSMTAHECGLDGLLLPRRAVARDPATSCIPTGEYVDHTQRRGTRTDAEARRPAQRIHVFWLLPPISPGLQQWRESSGSEARYEAFVRSHGGRYPRVVTVLDARRVPCATPSLYVDATHLSGRGAIQARKPRRRRSTLKADLGRPPHESRRRLDHAPRPSRRGRSTAGGHHRSADRRRAFVAWTLRTEASISTAGRIRPS